MTDCKFQVAMWGVAYTNPVASVPDSNVGHGLYKPRSLRPRT